MLRNYARHFGLLVAPLVNPRPGRNCCGWSEDRHPGEQRLRPQPRSQHPRCCLSGQVEESNGGSIAAVCSLFLSLRSTPPQCMGFGGDPSAPEARSSADLGPRVIYCCRFAPNRHRAHSSIQPLAPVSADSHPSTRTARVAGDPGRAALVGLALIPVTVHITRSPDVPDSLAPPISSR